MNKAEKIFTQGIEITITTESYELYGALWQDGVDENGKIYTIKTKAQREIDTAKAQAEWKEQQAGFARLKQDDYTTEEAAEYLGFKNVQSMWYHIKRGNITPLPKNGHDRYFSKEELDHYQANRRKQGRPKKSRD